MILIVAGKRYNPIVIDSVKPQFAIGPLHISFPPLKPSGLRTHLFAIFTIPNSVVKRRAKLINGALPFLLVVMESGCLGMVLIHREVRNDANFITVTSGND